MSNKFVKGDRVKLNPKTQKKSGLLVTNGTVVVASTKHKDNFPYLVKWDVAKIGTFYINGHKTVHKEEDLIRK